MLRFVLTRVFVTAAALALSSCAGASMSSDVGTKPALASNVSEQTRSPSGVPGSDNPSKAGSTMPSKEPGPNQLPSTSSLQTPATELRQDPLLDPALVGKSCGPAPANPYGYAVPGAKADATCRVCESAPVPLALCRKARNGRPLTESVLRSPNGRAVFLRGSLGFFPLMGTKIGGRCACKNTCYGFLRLRPANSDWLGAAPTEPAVLLGLGRDAERLLPKEMLDAYLSPEGPLACAGDDASLCCPFELSHATLKAEVVVSGVFDTVMIDERPVRLLKVMDICRAPN